MPGGGEKKRNMLSLGRVDFWERKRWAAHHLPKERANGGRTVMPGGKKKKEKKRQSRRGKFLADTYSGRKRTMGRSVISERVREGAKK